MNSDYVSTDAALVKSINELVLTASQFMWQHSSKSIYLFNQKNIRIMNIPNIIAFIDGFIPN